MNKTPLYQEHLRAGAKMMEFSGWQMPMQYEGIMVEHQEVRGSVGIFDLSHMGELVITGPDRLAALNYLTTNDVSRLKEGGVQYNLLTDASGGIIDDVLVYRTPSSYYLVVNAANTVSDREWIESHLQGDAAVTDVSAETALVAVQGPRACELVQRVIDASVSEIKPFSFQDYSYASTSVRVSRTGYTGEDGFELYLPNEHVGHLWPQLSEAKPIGLGARDTLRLEAKLALYGQDIDRTTTPLEAGLGRFVRFDKGDFIGRDALLQQKQEGIQRLLVGFMLKERGMPRTGYPITDGSNVIGSVTSGTISPISQRSIGLGYVPLTHAEHQTRVYIQIRNKHMEATIYRKSFRR